MAFNYDASASLGHMQSQRADTVDSQSTGGRDGIELVQLNNRWGDGSLSTTGGPQTPRTPRRILSQGGGQSSANQTPKKLQFSTPEVHTVPPSPSYTPKILITNRKREEEIVMANLRKKVPAFHLGPRRKNPQNGVVRGCGTGSSEQVNTNDATLDNRPSVSKVIVIIIISLSHLKRILDGFRNVTNDRKRGSLSSNLLHNYNILYFRGQHRMQTNRNLTRFHVRIT